MYKKDLIERNIDTFTEMIAKLLFGKALESDTTIYETQLEAAIIDCVNMPIDTVLQMDDKHLLDSLLLNEAFPTEKIDYLAELLFLYADGLKQKGNYSLAEKAFLKMQLLWDYATKHQKTVSFDRITKHEKRKEAFKKIINEH